jgi:putative transcriptional regulator
LIAPRRMKPKVKGMPESIYFNNQFIIAMPMLTDPNFFRTVIYICEHNESGAIGIVVNRPLTITLSDVLSQMNITSTDPEVNGLPVLFGGPVHQERGFVIHKPVGTWRSSVVTADDVAVTTSQDILEAIAESKGPENYIISLGYSNWQAGQLEAEITNNYWLCCPANENILFRVPFPDRWVAAAASIGVDVNKLSTDIGHG